MYRPERESQLFITTNEHEICKPVGAPRSKEGECGSTACRYFLIFNFLIKERYLSISTLVR